MAHLENQPITIQEYRKILKKRTCTIKELGETLGISTSKASQLARIEGFPVLKIGRSRLVILNRLDAWLSENIGECL